MEVKSKKNNIPILNGIIEGVKRNGGIMHMAHPNGRVCGAKRPKCEAERSHRL